MSEATTPLPIQPFHWKKTEHRAAFRPHKDPRKKRGGGMYKRQNEGLIVIDLTLIVPYVTSRHVDTFAVSHRK